MTYEMMFAIVPSLLLHNKPVVCRTSIVLGTAIPLALFLIWNAVILGTITDLDMGSDKIIDPLQQLRSSNGTVGVSLIKLNSRLTNLMRRPSIDFPLPVAAYN